MDSFNNHNEVSESLCPKCKNTITRHCGVANELSRFPKNSFPKFLRTSKRCEVVNFWQKEKKWKSISWF